jgi:hypothetical protein
MSPEKFLAAIASLDMDAAARALAPHWRNGRRPELWSDDEVRRAAIVLHREVTIDEAREHIARTFGAERCPSRSALQRFWDVLDKSKGKKGRRAA